MSKLDRLVVVDRSGGYDCSEGIGLYDCGDQSFDVRSQITTVLHDCTQGIYSFDCGHRSMDASALIFAAKPIIPAAYRVGQQRRLVRKEHQKL